MKVPRTLLRKFSVSAFRHNFGEHFCMKLIAISKDRRKYKRSNVYGTFSEFMLIKFEDAYCNFEDHFIFPLKCHHFWNYRAYRYIITFTYMYNSFRIVYFHLQPSTHLFCHFSLKSSPISEKSFGDVARIFCWRRRCSYTLMVRLNSDRSGLREAIKV